MPLGEAGAPDHAYERREEGRWLPENLMVAVHMYSR